MTIEALLVLTLILSGCTIYASSRYLKALNRDTKNADHLPNTDIMRSILFFEVIIWSMYPIWALAINFILPSEIEFQSVIGNSFVIIIFFSFLFGVLFQFRITGKLLGFSFDRFDKIIEKDLYISMNEGELDRNRVQQEITEIWVRSEIYGNEKSSTVLSRITTTDGLQEMTSDTISELQEITRTTIEFRDKTNSAMLTIILIATILLSVAITFLSYD